MARITSFKVVISKAGEYLMFRMMLSAVAAVPFRASDMQMAYTALQAWFLGSQVLARGRGIMRDIFFVFAWELSFVFYYFASENEVFMMFSPPGIK
jgi:hypothetical protein